MDINILFDTDLVITVDYKKQIPYCFTENEDYIIKYNIKTDIIPLTNIGQVNFEFNGDNNYINLEILNRYLRCYKKIKISEDTTNNDLYLKISQDIDIFDGNIKEIISNGRKVERDDNTLRYKDLIVIIDDSIIRINESVEDTYDNTENIDDSSLNGLDEFVFSGDSENLNNNIYDNISNIMQILADTIGNNSDEITTLTEESLNNIEIFKYDEVKDQIDEKCSICRTEFNNNCDLRFLPCCKHYYHMGCIDKWFREFNNKCPLCQKEI